MSLAEKIALSKANHERRPQDYYATPPEVTHAFMEYMAFPRSMVIREPCCGSGDMSRVLEDYGHTVVSSDIEDRGFGNTGIDYTKMPEVDPDAYDMDAVITNPPFSNALPIIRRALRDAPNVAMLLPSGYWHSARRAALFKARRPSLILSLTWRPVFVEERGTSPLMNVMWTVWQDAYTGRMTMFDLLEKPIETSPVRPVIDWKPLEGALTGLTEAMARV